MLIENELSTTLKNMNDVININIFIDERFIWRINFRVNKIN